MPRHRVRRGAGGTSCRVWPRALAETWTAAGVREAKADPCSLRARLARRCSIVGCGAPDRIRTCDLRLRRPTLYPLSYRRAATILAVHAQVERKIRADGGQDDPEGRRNPCHNADRA